MLYDITDSIYSTFQIYLQFCKKVFVPLLAPLSDLLRHTSTIKQMLIDDLGKSKLQLLIDNFVY